MIEEHVIDLAVKTTEGFAKSNFHGLRELKPELTQLNVKEKQ